MPSGTQVCSRQGASVCVCVTPQAVDIDGNGLGQFSLLAMTITRDIRTIQRVHGSSSNSCFCRFLLTALLGCVGDPDCGLFSKPARFLDKNVRSRLGAGVAALTTAFCLLCS